MKVAQIIDKSVEEKCKNYEKTRNSFKNPKTFKQEEEKKTAGYDYFSHLSVAEKENFKVQLARKKARENFIDYLRYVYPNYITTKFHLFLAKICDEVVKKIEKGERVKICLSVPPRHGKSATVTEALPSWFVGRNPDKHCILTAYNAELAESFEDSNRKKTREHGKDIFGIEISDSQDNKTKYAIKNADGFVMGVGIEGGITGNGGELIIVDDPYKNSTQANSQTEREKIERVFRDSVITRLQGKGNGIIVIHTRWHEDDLIGKLMKEKGWYVINIPAVCDTTDIYLHRQIGETLCPDLGFDFEWAESTRENVGLKVWEALYQGHPSIDGGEIFKRNMFNFYTNSTKPLVFDKLTISCDLSFGGKKTDNDPCAIQVWGKCGGNHYLLHRVKRKMTFIEMCDCIKSVSALYPQAIKKIVEKKANGQAVIDALNQQIGGFVPYDPKGNDKVGRANYCLTYFEAGNIFFPSKDIDKGIEETVDEFLKFPNGSHDDEVDATTQYLICENQINGGRICNESIYKQLNNAFRGKNL